MKPYFYFSHFMSLESFCTFFFYLSFVSPTFTTHRAAREGGGHSISSSLPLQPASRALRYYLGDYCRELTSAHSLQPDSNREPLVSKCKSLTTKYGPCVKMSAFLFLILLLEFPWYYCFLAISLRNVLDFPVHLSRKN